MVSDRPDELDEVFWAFTLAHQIEDLLDYDFSKKEIETAISEEIACVCNER